MNYATLRIKKENQRKALEAAIALFKAKTPLNPTLHLEDGYGEIRLKAGCPIPFFRKAEKITFYSVAVCGLHRHAEEPWRNYQRDMVVCDAYTYLTVLFKMCLCQAVGKKLKDDGVGKWREDINAPKFASLKAWKTAHTRQAGWLDAILQKACGVSTTRQDKKFFPELFGK